MEEIWKTIKDYESLYEVSNLGRVRSKKTNKIMAMYKQNKGYYCLSLSYKSKTYHPTIHRLVAEHFLPKIEGMNQVNHIDGDKSNNTVANLEWCNQRLNYNHGMKNFLYSHNENHYFAKLTNEQVKCIPEFYRLGFIRATIAKILNIESSSLEAIENGISYRELNLNFSNIHKSKYKDLPNIKLPSNIWEIFKDNTVLNTLIAQGKVSV